MSKTAKLSTSDAEIIRNRRREIKDKRTDKRMYAVQLRAEGMRNKDVAEKLDVTTVAVSRWGTKYLENGIDALMRGHYGGNHRNISEEEEIKFLNRFKRAAEKGQIITVAEIAQAYDEQFGMEHSSNSTIYYLLHKHGWRKLMPRSKHPKKASEEVIETSKNDYITDGCRWCGLPTKQRASLFLTTLRFFHYHRILRR